MPIHSPVPLASSSSTDHSPLRRLVSLGQLLWHDLRSALRPAPSPISLLPFDFLSGQVSALVEGAGTEPPLVPGYAFHSHFVPALDARVRFTIDMPGLTATSGRLLIEIYRLDEQGIMLKPVIKRIKLAALARRGGSIEVSTPTRPGYSYAVMGTIKGDARGARADRIEIGMTGGEPSEALEARFAAARLDFLSAPGQGVLAPIIVERTATLADPVSQMCTAEQMREPDYGRWCDLLGIEHRAHRKQWEFAFIGRALEHHGAIREGARGLGFGVGMEPMPSAFAHAGCHIVATDLPSDDARAQAWTATDQLAADLGKLHWPALCDEKIFFERVSYRAVDMNHIPGDLAGFDFTWSSCAYEHLGSIDAGLAFFERSLACLAPGGLAVHTTELNLSSNSDTLDNGPTVIFRRQDFERLAARLIEQGHEVFPITFDCGDSELDRVIDLPPYSNDPHLKLQLLRWVSTSFGMIVRKKA